MSDKKDNVQEDPTVLNSEYVFGGGGGTSDEQLEVFEEKAEKDVKEDK